MFKNMLKKIEKFVLDERTLDAAMVLTCINIAVQTGYTHNIKLCVIATIEAVVLYIVAYKLQKKVREI